LPTKLTPRLIKQKARSQAWCLRTHSPPTACKCAVSGTFSLPSPGCFSLFGRPTIRYRSLGNTYPWGVGPPDSCALSRDAHYSRTPRRERSGVAYGAITRFGFAFQTNSATGLFCNSGRDLQSPRGSHNPLCTTVAALHAEGLGSFAFAHRYSRSRNFLSSPEGT
jgi:hypothetical protein